MADESDSTEKTLALMLERMSTIYNNEAPEQFRGRVTSTFISLIACVQELQAEVKALKAAQAKGGGSTDYSDPNNSGNHAALSV